MNMLKGKVEQMLDIAQFIDRFRKRKFVEKSNDKSMEQELKRLKNRKTAERKRWKEDKQ